jgi:hypothetical protein
MGSPTYTTKWKQGGGGIERNGCSQLWPEPRDQEEEEEELIFKYDYKHLVYICSHFRTFKTCKIQCGCENNQNRCWLRRVHPVIGHGITRILGANEGLLLMNNSGILERVTSYSGIVYLSWLWEFHILGSIF